MSNEYTFIESEIDQHYVLLLMGVKDYLVNKSERWKGSEVKKQLYLFAAKEIFDVITDLTNDINKLGIDKLKSISSTRNISMYDIIEETYGKNKKNYDNFMKVFGI